jgi:maltooligosyltrehalose synthase
VPRLVATLMADPDQPPLGDQAWSDTRILLPAEGVRPHYRNVFTDSCVAVHHEDGRAFLRAAEVFEHFPVATLT